MASTEIKVADTVKDAFTSVGAARWGLIAFSIGLASSSILSITSITNAMSGNDKITKDMNPYFSVFPILVFCFCIAFSLAVARLDTSIRKTAIFIFVGVAYIFSMLTLHLSTFNITSSL
jgi:hypothetical protein